MNHWEDLDGSPRPMGVRFVPPRQAYNFALYSKHATSVTLHLYRDRDTEHPLYSYSFVPLLNKSGRIRHCRLPAATVNGASYYAYQIDGPMYAARGHRFDPQKILLDPYARAVHFPPGFDRAAAIAPGANDGKAPLGCIHTRSANNNPPDDPRSRHTHDTIIYELHVKGFTQQAGSGVGPDVDRAHDSHSLAYHLSGSSQNDQDIYVMINAWHEDLIFTVQAGLADHWRRVVDTALESPYDSVDAGQEAPLKTLTYRVKARSVVLLLSQ